MEVPAFSRPHDEQARDSEISTNLSGSAATNQTVREFPVYQAVKPTLNLVNMS